MTCLAPTPRPFSAITCAAFTFFSFESASFMAAATRLHPASADGYDLSVVARHEFNSRFGISVRAGALRWDNRITTRTLDGVAVSRNDHGVDALFGIGASVNIAGNWSATAEAIRYGVRGDDIDFLAAGLVYRWR